MPDHPDFVRQCSITRDTGAFGEPRGTDRWRMPTYGLSLLINDTVTTLVGCRFDMPTETIARIERARSTC